MTYITNDYVLLLFLGGVSGAVFEKQAMWAHVDANYKNYGFPIIMGNP